MENQTKTVFSGIKPTGNPTIGNYIGALKNWVDMSKQFDCYFSVVDLHSLTISIEPAVLRSNTKRLFALLIAMGIDTQKSTLFIQSHVSAHAELTWVLNCMTLFGQAKRMTQFKDMSVKNPQNINVGLFDYPVLMAADILLYNADLVPIGRDQVQHLELARDIAQRFNTKYSPTFVVPEGFLPKAGEKIQSLNDPEAKMGKSEDERGTVYILDEPDIIVKKFKSAVTDCGSGITYDIKNKKGISNLLTIYSVFTNQTLKQAEKECADLSYADFKSRVAEAVVEGLRPVRENYNKIISQTDYLNQLIQSGAERAAAKAYKILSKVYRKVGLR